MCGIAGFLASTKGIEDEAKEIVITITKRLGHRGPDAEGYHWDAPCFLGHRRLAIVDLSPDANQPMANEDKTIWLVINGEIYNFLDLRDYLVKKGHVFRSRSDSEVVVHLYEEEGPEFVHKLRGMFAFGLWDSRRKCLLLARDRFGKKPLNYYFAKEGLIFASELQALMALRQVPRVVDFEAIDAYLALQYVPAPMTAYKHIRKLPPGHVAFCYPGRPPQVQQYYRLSFTPLRQARIEKVVPELREKIEDAVRVRLIADVPLGAFLSGGLDSSAVVAFMRQHSNRPIRTFSIGFPEPDESELHYAREVARFLGTEHAEMVVKPDMVDVLPRLVQHYGEPFADTSAVPTWYLSQFAKSQVTVALSGDAGDENFGGYRRYRFFALARLLGGFPKPVISVLSRVCHSLPFPKMQVVREFVATLKGDDAQKYLWLVAHFPYEHRIGLYSPDMKRTFVRDAIAERFRRLFASATAKDSTGRLLETDFATYLPDDILVKVDIASMAHALEVRCPFLDHHVVEYVASLPTTLKVNMVRSKIILKEVLRNLLPEKILSRRKKGFSLPIDRWIREELRPMVRDLLLSKRFVERGIFDTTAIAQMLHEHDKGVPHGLRIWNLLVLELWFRTFMDGS